MSVRSIRPGWYLLAALAIYAVVVTVMLRGAQHEARSLRMGGAVVVSDAASARADGPAAAGAVAGAVASAPDGLWFPIPGAELPRDDAHLPGSARPYRNGVSQGFDFYDGDAGVPIVYGTPVVASAAGEVIRADRAYAERSPSDWATLLARVAQDGADATQLDELRGRQIWIRVPDGRVLRYGHLSSVRDGIVEGRRVYRGEVVGYVGNSGTDDGVAGSRTGVRLHFEIWDGADYFGEDLTSQDVRLRAASVFAGP